MNILQEYIANRIQLLAKAKGKTYKDLAHALNVTESFIQKVHTHKKHYNISHLYVLSRLLDSSVSEFYPTDFDAYKRIYPYSSLEQSDFSNYLKEMEEQIIYGKED